jgi:hypothetical protein
MEDEENKEPDETVREKKSREGWDDAFKRYVSEGEDELLLPDFLDVELEKFL